MGAIQMHHDIRWIQRFENFKRAIEQLKEAVELNDQRDLSRLETQGLIQGFEYTHELAWNTLKDFLESRGNNKIFGSKDATKEAFKLGIIEEGQVWMNMIISRNKSSHTYNEEIADVIVNDILTSYYHQFKLLKLSLEKLKEQELNKK